MSERALPPGWEDLAPVVPVPAIYLDKVMPALTDTEWRVLCVVIRQTLGWTQQDNPSFRKERDWISQSQFRERTGKSRDSLSRAIAGLITKNLIHVENPKHEPLDTARKRQSARTRLYYRLNLAALRHV